MEDTPIDTVNVENPMSHHMRELKPTPRWGIGIFDQWHIVKNPLVVPIKATAMVLERKWISAIPKGFLDMENQRF